MGEFSLELNDEQLQLQEWVHQFAEDVIRPAAEEWDEREEFPFPIVEQAAEIGLYSWEFLANGMLGDKTGLTIPVAIEELFWGDAGIGMAIMGSGLAASGIAAAGTQEQLMEWVPQCYGEPGNLALGAFCASEPDAGSDLANAGMRAERDGDEWVLNGSKVWTSRGAYAHWGMCLARTDVSVAKHRGLTMFAVDMGAPGVEVRPLEQINGDRHFTEVFVTDVRVPDTDRIGDLGAGWGITVETLAHERATIGGRAFGGGDSEDVGLPSWLEEWRAGGWLDDSVARQAAMRAFILYRVNQMAVARVTASAGGSAPGPEGSAAKLRSVAAFKERAYLGKALAGAAGMLSETVGHLEFLTAPSMSIRGGTDEVQRNIVGERILGLPGEPRVDKDVPFSDLRKSH